MDASGDNKISKEEWTARYGSDAGFEDYDINGDGVIDPDEWRASRMADHEFRKIDVNADGKISKEEWIERCVLPVTFRVLATTLLILRVGSRVSAAAAAAAAAPLVFRLRS